MPELLIRHELDCSEETYWEKCVFDLPYNRKLYDEVLKFPVYEVVDDTDHGATRSRKVRIEPPTGNLPGPVKKLVGDRLGYTETGTFDKAKKRYTFDVVPSAMPDKIKTSGELYCEKLGDKRIARIARIDVSVKIFAVGKMVEDKIAQDLRHSYDVAAKFTNDWCRDKGY